jgi:hypothetical protein
MQPRSVDLPAPFGPIRHVSEPRSIRTETSSTAATEPNDFRTPSTSHADAASAPSGSIYVVLLLNAVPKSGRGLHLVIWPAHMLGIWIALWFRGPK